MTEPPQVRQRGHQDVGVGAFSFEQHHPSAATLPRRRPGRRLVETIAVVSGVALVVILPPTAQAKPPKLIESDSDTSSMPFVVVSGFIERPKTVTYRVTMDPPGAAVISGSSDCDRGKRSIGRDFELPISSSGAGKVPLTISRADSCIVSLSLDYDDYDQAGTLKLELFAKKRKQRHRS